MEQTKVCKKCGIEKPINSFALREKGWRRGECYECKKQINSEYRQKNLERLRQYDKNRTIGQKEKRREMRRKSYLKNREMRLEKAKIYYMVNRETVLQKTKERIKKNPEKARINWNNRDARRRSVGYRKVTSLEIADLFNQQKGECFYCSIKLDKYHIDHIVPLARGGVHKFYNLVLTCPTCNLRKNSKDPEVFVNEILEKII